MLRADKIKETHQKVDPDTLIVHHFAYKMYFEGAHKDPITETSGKSTEYYNYFVGKDPAHWASAVHGYNGVMYRGLYPGIDLKVYSREIDIKYDFIVAPHADPEKIRLHYSGPDALNVVDGNLEIKAGFAGLVEMKPYAYQIIRGVEEAVPCAFRLTDNILTFYFPSGYNKNVRLVIDPDLVFASYTGSTQDNWGYTATYDADGDLYGGGITFGTGYPFTVGSFQTSFGGGDGYPGWPPYNNGCDVTLSKFTPDGSSLIFSTYLGGDGNETPHSLVVDNSGDLLVYGATGSDNFPTTAGAYDVTFGGGSNTIVSEVIEFPSGSDIFVTKFSADGTSLLASTYVGGTSNDGYNIAGALEYNYGDHARGEIFTDGSDNIFVASSTYSSNFPTTAGAFQTMIGGGQDGCVFKLDPTMSNLLWSTFIGGSNSDGAYSLKLNSSGDVLVAGGTNSTNFPTTAGAWHTTYQGGTADGWVVRLNGSGTSMLAGTYAGTSLYDQAYFVDRDAEDNIYITGQTKGSWPVTAGVYSDVNGRQFITKLDANLSAPVYSTIFGSGGSNINISPAAFLVDDCENVYVSGWGGNVNYEGTTIGLPVTPDAMDPTTDGSDFYFFVLDKNAIDLLYASFFGGNLNFGEHVDGGTSRFDKAGTIYQGVCAGCGGWDDFPTTPGAWSNINGSSNCNLGVAKIDFALSGILAASDADPSIDGCVPFNVDFVNNSIGGVDYIWDFGDGSPQSTLFEPSHLYTVPGTYNVSLVAIDSNSCNIADTSYLVINVLNDSVYANFDFSSVQNCDSLTATFTNTSISFPTTTYLWDFGDGTTSTDTAPVHEYYEPGSYTITLTITDPNSCNGLDTMQYTVNYLYEFNTGFTPIVQGCIPIDAEFISNEDNADEFYWDFGDGTTGTGTDVIHTFDSAGIYIVSLISTSCGLADTQSIAVEVDDIPVAFFDQDPEYVIMNTLAQFTNESQHAVTYFWEFGDGGTSTDKDPQHLFGNTGDYNVCLTATNTNGCPDMYCRTVSSEASGVADIPTAFTPNGDGNNDILYVKGFGISTMDLRIFNRWGELVFESTDQKKGWDGTYHTRPQEMEVYVYTLSVQFEDATSLYKEGNITLLR